jgi:uncharacterized damage-inducible protein DinB
MTEYDDIPTSADEVLEEVHAARAEIEAIIDELSQEQMTQATDEGGWSIKDHLAHIAEWQRRGLGLIEGRSSWEALDIDQKTYESTDIDGTNEIIHERNKDRPLVEVLTDFRKTQEKVILTLEQMNEDDLERSLPASDSSRYRRVIDVVRGNFSGHDHDHVEDIRQLANEPVS